MSNPSTPAGRILNILKRERNEISAVYFYAILNGLIQLSLPLGVQAIIGIVQGVSVRASLVVLISLVVSGVLIAGLMQVNQMKIIEKIQQKLFVRYSFVFAEHIPKLDLKKTDSLYLPELVNRFFDIQVLQKSLSKILLDIPGASIQILFGLLLLSFYHPAFILFGLILILLLWLILRYTGLHGLHTSIEESTFKYNVANWLEETARVIKSIKLAKQNDLHLRKTDEQVTGYLKARNSHFRVLLFQYNVLVIFKTVITAAMLVVGTLLLVNQQLNIGQFIAAEIVILLVLNSVEKLIMNLGSVYDTLTAIEKLAAVTDQPAEKTGAIRMPSLKKGLKLEMKEVSFGYTEETEVLKKISFQIRAGEKICIRGVDSSGKSTLLRLMAGAYPDFKGAYLLDDIPAGNYNLESFRAQMGVLLGQQDIFHGTLWENIVLGSEQINPETVIRYARITGLSDFIATLKNGFDTVLDPTGKRLPRNVVHRILLVRALVCQPRLLLLEEPWQNFEERYRLQIIKLLAELEHTTVIVFTNDNAFAAHCNQQITLGSGGEIISITRKL